MVAVEVSLNSTADVATIVSVVCVGLAFVVRMTLGRRLRSIETRLDAHDVEFRSVRKTANRTRLGVARIEGYMAAKNGGGERLPDSPLSVAVAAEVEAEEDGEDQSDGLDED